MYVEISADRNPAHSLFYPESTMYIDHILSKFFISRLREKRYNISMFAYIIY